MKPISLIQTILACIGIVLILLFNKTLFVIGLSLMLLAWLMAVISIIVYPNH